MVIASELDSAPYALALPSTPKVLDELQLTVYYEEFTRQAQLLNKLRHGLTWWKLSRYVAHLLCDYAGCTVASEVERCRVHEVAPASCAVAVMPNGVDIDAYTYGLAEPEPNTLVYSGALTYSANFDAIDFFLRGIFPLIQAERPEVRLFITGRSDAAPISRLPGNANVTFTGYLDDVRSKIASSWVSVVPLRVGGGTRLKILEALALGTPVVATRKGAEGLDIVPGRDLLIADDPAEFAGQVLRLLRSRDLRQQLSQNGRQLVEARYSWTVIGQELDRFLETVVNDWKNGRRTTD
jgi:glycosyltransferase involved in cell wall biosynthesis